jgi:hypothetical protein
MAAVVGETARVEIATWALAVKDESATLVAVTV